MAAGAIGISCATIGEAEAMALGGIGGILVTAPLVSPDALARLGRLLLRHADIAVVADHPASVAQLATVAAAAGRRLDVVVDVDVGMGRTGCLDIADAVALARQVAAAPALNYAGIQAYWGNLQQVSPLPNGRGSSGSRSIGCAPSSPRWHRPACRPPSSPGAAPAAMASTPPPACSRRSSRAPTSSWIPATARSAFRRTTIPSLPRCSWPRPSSRRTSRAGWW